MLLKLCRKVDWVEQGVRGSGERDAQSSSAIATLRYDGDGDGDGDGNGDHEAQSANGGNMNTERHPPGTTPQIELPLVILLGAQQAPIHSALKQWGKGILLTKDNYRNVRSIRRQSVRGVVHRPLAHTGQPAQFKLSIQCTDTCVHCIVVVSSVHEFDLLPQ
jgi:hypothetical protein